MASGVSIDVKGLRELGERMKGLAVDMNNKIARAGTAAAATVVRKAAQANAPVDTGNLRKNITVRRLPPGETTLTSAHIVTVRQGKLTDKQRKKGLKDAYYAKFVEFGTVKAAAQPFLRPALEEHTQEAIGAMKDRIAARLTKAGA